MASSTAAASASAGRVAAPARSAVVARRPRPRSSGKTTSTVPGRDVHRALGQRGQRLEPGLGRGRRCRAGRPARRPRPTSTDTTNCTSAMSPVSAQRTALRAAPRVASVTSRSICQRPGDAARARRPRSRSGARRAPPREHRHDAEQPAGAATSSTETTAYRVNRSSPCSQPCAGATANSTSDPSRGGDRDVPRPANAEVIRPGEQARQPRRRPARPARRTPSRRDGRALPRACRRTARPAAAARARAPRSRRSRPASAPPRTACTARAAAGGPSAACTA